MATQRTIQVNNLTIIIEKERFKIEGMQNWIWMKDVLDETIIQMVKSVYSPIFKAAVCHAKETMQRRANQEIEVLYMGLSNSYSVVKQNGEFE